jgi:hypothetical protein
MSPKPNDSPTDFVVPPIKIKHHISRRRMVASGLLVALMTFFATSALLLFFAFIFAPQLSNALWNTDMTQQALYGTSATVNNAQVIVDMTSTALAIQANDQHDLLETMTQRNALLNARESDLIATDEAIMTSIHATQTAEILVNEQQRTQAAVNYRETQSSINQQSTLIAIQATATQLALEDRPQVTPTADSRPFILREEAQLIPHPEADCNWQGIAGMVFDLQNAPTGDSIYQVRLLSTGEDVVVGVGDNQGLGDSYNWAVRVSSNPNSDVYFLRLETLAGAALSPMARVIFTNSCNENLAIVNFVQIKNEVGQSD